MPRIAVLSSGSPELVIQVQTDGPRITEDAVTRQQQRQRRRRWQISSSFRYTMRRTEYSRHHARPSAEYASLRELADVPRSSRTIAGRRTPSPPQPVTASAYQSRCFRTARGREVDAPRRRPVHSIFISADATRRYRHRDFAPYDSHAKAQCRVRSARGTRRAQRKDAQRVRARR